MLTQPRSPGRSGTDWNRVRALILKDHPPCWLCGKAIDYEAKPRSRWSASVDHVVPISQTRDMSPADARRISLDIGLLRPAHFGCNSRRGCRPVKRQAQPTTQRTSRKW